MARSDDIASALAVTKQDYRDAMALLGAAATIVTTDGAGGRAGFTASAVCSVTDEPPTLLVCLNRTASVHDAFTRNGALCVNVLAGEHAALARLFGGRTPAELRFAAASWSTLATGAPVLDACLVAFDCRIAETVAVQSHDILLCRVVAIRRGGDDRGLVYFGRAFHAVTAGAGR